MTDCQPRAVSIPAPIRLTVPGEDDCILLWILLTLLPAYTGFELNNMFGVIQSPGFPNPYGNNMNQIWNISVPDGFVIKLYFSYFNLELSYLCEYDYVKIESDSVELARLCGQNSTDTEDAPSDKQFYSSSNNMTVIFHTDYSNENSYPGFIAHYAAEDVDECNLPNHTPPMCDHRCHNYLGGYHCSCKLGYFLDSDERNCRVLKPYASTHSKPTAAVNKSNRLKFSGVECCAGFRSSNP